MDRCSLVHAQLSVIRSREVSARGRLVLYYSNGKYSWCTDSCPLQGGVRYWECPLLEVPLYVAFVSIALVVYSSEKTLFECHMQFCYTIFSASQYSHHVQIYMCGFNDLQLEKLCKLVNYGGGVRLVLYEVYTRRSYMSYCVHVHVNRYGYLSELVSHVVMGAQQSSEVTAIMQLNNRYCTCTGVSQPHPQAKIFHVHLYVT